MNEDKIGYCLDCEGADSGHPDCVKLNEPVMMNDGKEYTVTDDGSLKPYEERLANEISESMSKEAIRIGINNVKLKHNLNKVCGKPLDTQDGQVYINDSLIARAEHKINAGISLNSNIEQIIAARGENYGVFADGAAIMRDLKSVMHSTDGWERLSPSQQEALDMIQHKIGRVLNGKPDYDDNWRDIAGYATLVLNELTNQ